MEEYLGGRVQQIRETTVKRWFSTVGHDPFGVE